MPDPAPAPPPKPPQTPPRKRDSSTAGFLSGDSTRATLDNDIRAELGDHVYIDIPAPDFFDRLLPPPSAVDLGALERVYREALQRRDYDVETRRWSAFPAVPSEARVVSWFTSVVNPLLRTATPAVHPWLASTGADFTSATGAARRVEMVVSGIDQPPARTHDWRNIRAFCELKSNENRDIARHSRTGVQLTNYAREMFHAQPTRLSIQGCTLCSDNLMRCFFFDRAGVLATEAFSIHEHPQWFLRAMLFYCTADAAEMGLDPTVTTTIRRPRSGRPNSWAYHRSPVPIIYDPTMIHWGYGGPLTYLPTVHIPDPENPAARVTFMMRSEPFFVGTAMVSRGTACWPARILQDDNNEDVASSPLIGADAGEGGGGEGRGGGGEQEEDKDEWPFVVKTQWRDHAREAEGVILGHARGIRGVVQCYSHEDCSWSGTVIDIKTYIRQGILEDPSSPQRKKLAMMEGTTLQHRHPDTLPSERLNRVLTRIVMQPCGRTLTTFENAAKLLRAFRDCIAAHEALVCTQAILHRDISINNLMLPPNRPVGSEDDAGGRGKVEGGFMIDFDLAVSIYRVAASGALHRTGTPIFMAIRVLDYPRDLVHTFRYDLESFMYVMVWVCTFYTSAGGRRKDFSTLDRPDDSLSGNGTDTKVRKMENMTRASRWAKGTWAERANHKTSETTGPYWQDLLADMEPGMKAVGGGAIPALLTAWRDALFAATILPDGFSFFRNPKNDLSPQEREGLERLRQRFEKREDHGTADEVQSSSTTTTKSVSFPIYRTFLDALDVAIAAVEAESEDRHD